MNKLKLVIFIGSFFILSSSCLTAQYVGYPLLGIEGLQAGSQLTPGYYFSLGYYDWYNIGLYDPQGQRIGQDVSFRANVFFTPAVHGTTKLKILGANYGFAVTEWVLNGLVNVVTPSRSFSRSSAYGFGDMYVQPLILGWHKPHADITLGYSFWAPSGGNHGLHQWQNEFDAGTTLYLDAARKWNVSTQLFYDWIGTKNDKDVKVGDLLTLEGGAARTFFKGAGSLGAAYAAQWSITRNSGPDIPSGLPVTNGRVFGVGPEFNMPVFAKGKNLGVAGFRYLFLLGPKQQLGGNVLVASFTFARLSTQ